jgi:hypothetical protein
MKKLLSILIIIFSSQTLTYAEDFTDLQIEGMSVGDSLLDHFSKKKINNSKVDWYDSLEKNRFVAFAFNSPKFEKYDFVDVWTIYNDNKFLINTIAGAMYFGENKEIKDINNCYSEQKIIANEVHKELLEAEKTGPTKLKHSIDPSGQSTYTDIYLRLNNGYEIVISCYDWSDELLKKENKADHLFITIRSNEVDEWLF